MKARSLSFALLAFVAQTFLNPLPSAWAANDATTVAQETVQTKLVQPLAKKEESRPKYSRAVMPPSARRVRILDKTPQVDTKGKSFFTFAIDESRGFISPDPKIAEATWMKDTITGCVYVASGEVLIKRGDVYYPGSVLMGVRAPTPPAGVCRIN